MKLDAIRAVEACYGGGRDDREWLSSILEALAPLDAGPGLIAQVYRVLPDGSRVVESETASGALTSGAMAQLNRDWDRLARSAPPGALGRLFAPSPPVDYALRRGARAGARVLEQQRVILGRSGVADALGLFASEPDGRTVLVASGLPAGRRPLPARTIERLTHLCAHLGSGLRLRRALFGGPPANGAAPAEAVLDAGGRVVDAAGGARPREARRSLAEAVRRMDRARGPLRRVDPDEALKLWQGLVDGTWSLVDQCDSDGKRYVLARRNRPGVRDPKALSERQRAVLAFAAMGHQNKFIGYLLGLSPSAVSSHLDAARRKLGGLSRGELVHRFAPVLAERSAPVAGARGRVVRPAARR